MTDTTGSGATTTPAETGRFGRWAMWACCAVMALPILAFFVAGGALSGLYANAGAFLPLVACLGLHLVMHRLMGRSCHGTASVDPSDEAPTVAPTPATSGSVPSIPRQASS